jgi:hypothetical protein
VTASALTGVRRADATLLDWKYGAPEMRLDLWDLTEEELWYCGGDIGLASELEHAAPILEQRVGSPGCSCDVHPHQPWCVRYTGTQRLQGEPNQ